MMRQEWRTFNGGAWEKEINVRNFIQTNYTPYDGTSDFLEGPTEDTTDLWNEVLDLYKQERERRCSRYGYENLFLPLLLIRLDISTKAKRKLSVYRLMSR